MQAADIVGIRAMLVHAISEDAKRFYERPPSPVEAKTPTITLRHAEAVIGENDT